MIVHALHEVKCDRNLNPMPIDLKEVKADFQTLPLNIRKIPIQVETIKRFEMLNAT